MLCFELLQDSKQKSHFKLISNRGNKLFKVKTKEITQIAVRILICSIIMVHIFLSLERLMVVLMLDGVECL